MPIEVVKRGQNPQGAILTGACMTCGTEVKGPRKDWTNSMDQRDPGHFVTCPECYKAPRVVDSDGKRQLFRRAVGAVHWASGLDLLAYCHESGHARIAERQARQQQVEVVSDGDERPALPWVSDDVLVDVAGEGEGIHGLVS